MFALTYVPTYLRAGKNGFGGSDQIFIDEKWLLFKKGLTSIERYSLLVSVYASSTSTNSSLMRPHNRSASL